METHTHGNKSPSKREIWKRHLDRQQSSSLTQVAYCQQEGLSLATFQYWKRRLLAKPVKAPRLRFVPIPPKTTAAPLEPEIKDTGACWVRLHIHNAILEIPDNIDPARLRVLVTVLREGGDDVAH